MNPMDLEPDQIKEDTSLEHDENIECQESEKSAEESSDDNLNLNAETTETDELLEFESEAVEDIEYLEDQQVLSIVESILFASSKPQGLGVFKQVFKATNVDTSKIKKTIEALKIEYAGGSRGITIEETTGGFQLRTKSDNMVFLKRMIKGRTFKLSGPALEVLSIVAYKQPCIKSDVDEIRGVESGHILRGLMDRGLVSFAGKSELPGKPMLYSTSRKFLEIFGLRNLNELPSLSEIDELLPDGIEEQVEEKQTLDQLTDQLSKDAVETYSEGEEELGKITDKLSEISSSTEFFEMEKQRLKDEKDKMRAQDIEDALTVGEEVAPKDIKWLEKYRSAFLLANEQQQEKQSAQNEPLPSEKSDALSEEISDESSIPSNHNKDLSASKIEGNNDEGSQASTVKKIGDVDVSSLKDDLDFLDS